MATSELVAREFVCSLHQRLSESLSSGLTVRRTIESLSIQNAFPESCFCKALVLPTVDALATGFLAKQYGASRSEIWSALRCEGCATPMYQCHPDQVGFSSHSRSNNYHPGDKSGRCASSRRSPDFCIRLADRFRMLGEVKYVPRYSAAELRRLLAEMRDYMLIKSEPDSDWGHDFAYGLLYEYGADSDRVAELNLDHWSTERIGVSIFRS